MGREGREKKRQADHHGGGVGVCKTFGGADACRAGRDGVTRQGRAVGGKGGSSARALVGK